MDLPVLDISQPNEDLAIKLVDAVSQYGFVYIKSNGLALSSGDVDDMFALSKQFFALPTDEKEPFSVNSGSSGGNGGWFGMHGETLDPKKQKRGDFKEAFNMNEFRDHRAQQPLPDLLQQNFGQLDDFSEKCHAVCLRIMELFATGLGIEPDWFAQRHDRSKGPSGSVFRLLYYPHVPSSTEVDQEGDIRAGAHSDYGTITLLFQRPGQPGLEISTDGEQKRWDPVPVNPTSEPDLPVLVNIGDLLSYWTNGLFRSTVHRVVFPTDGPSQDRYSIAYFCHPVDEAELVPVPSKLVSERTGYDGASTRNGGGAMTAKEHLESRLAATYTWKGKE